MCPKSPDSSSTFASRFERPYFNGRPHSGIVNGEIGPPGGQTSKEPPVGCPGGYASVYLFYFSGSLPAVCKAGASAASVCDFFRFMISFPTTTTPTANVASMT